MELFHKSLVRSLVEPRLEELLAEIASISSHGFKVAVQCRNKILKEVFYESLSRKLGPLRINLKSSPTQECTVAESSMRKGSVLVCDEATPHIGHGFVLFQLPSVESLLPSITTVVTRVLQELSLQNYLDCFGAKTVGQLKRVLSARGFFETVDAIAEVAFRAGFSGNEELCSQYLDGMLHSSSLSPQSKLTEVVPEEFFELILSLSSQPHTFVKAALSYYVVKTSGASVTVASRRLNISRSTLHQHLRAAEQHDVQRLFSKGPNSLSFVQTAPTEVETLLLN